MKFNCFIGFPTETKKEASETFKMIKRYRVDADMLAVGRFVLERDVEIFKNPQKFKITITDPYDKETELNLLYHFKPAKGMGEKTAELLIKSFTNKYVFSICRRSNVLFRDHHTFFLEKAESSWFKKYKGPLINKIFQYQKINKNSILKLNEDVLIYLFDRSKKEYGVYHTVSGSIFKISSYGFKILNICRKEILLKEVIKSFKKERRDTINIKKFVLKMLKYNVLMTQEIKRNGGFLK